MSFLIFFLFFFYYSIFYCISHNFLRISYILILIIKLRTNYDFNLFFENFYLSLLCQYFIYRNRNKVNFINNDVGDKKKWVKFDGNVNRCQSEPAIQAMQFLDVITVKDPAQKSHFYRSALIEALPFIPKVTRSIYCLCVLHTSCLAIKPSVHRVYTDRVTGINSI